MTTTTWNRGDVVFIPGVGRAICTGAGDRVLVGREDSNERHTGGFAAVRQLVVIDPEDLEQARRLRKAFRDEGGHALGADGVAAMQRALRSLNKPPKPDEPTGLGSVVEDSNGTSWILTNPRGEWKWQPANAGAGQAKHFFRHWDEIDVIRVVTTGVTS